MRYVKAVLITPLAVLVTLLLLFLMYSLINKTFIDPEVPPQTPLGPVHMPDVPDTIDDIYDRPQRPQIHEEDEFRIVEPKPKERNRQDGNNRDVLVTKVDRPTDTEININLNGVFALIAPVVPDYPARALARGVEGSVTLRFTVTAAGTVRDIEILEAVTADGTPTTLFNNAAIRALQRFRYSPQMDGDQPVEMVGVTHRLVFQIKDS